MDHHGMGHHTSGSATDEHAHHHQPIDHRQSIDWSAAGRFIRHLLEMLVAMVVGMAVLDALFLWAAGLIGYTSIPRQFPELFALVMTVNMSVAMAAWMRYRRMGWQPIGEMSGAMLAEAILLIGVVSMGILPRGSLILWQHLLMIPAMLVPMLLRLDLYTMGHADHRKHTAHATWDHA